MQLLNTLLVLSLSALTSANISNPCCTISGKKDFYNKNGFISTARVATNIYLGNNDAEFFFTEEDVDRFYGIAVLKGPCGDYSTCVSLAKDELTTSNGVVNYECKAHYDPEPAPAGLCYD